MAKDTWKQAKRDILNAAKAQAADSMVDMLAKAIILNPSSVKPEAKIEPLVKVLHKIGECKLIQFSLVAGGPRYYLATYKGKRAEAGHPLMAVKALRTKAPKAPRIVKLKGELVGVRVWKLCGEFLSPVTRNPDYEASGPVMVADAMPSMTNGSGFWAIKPESNKLKALILNYDAHVSGIVGLFGRVVEHDIGYRAEKMIIRSLRLLIPSTRAFRELLAQRYECEVFSEVE